MPYHLGGLSTINIELTNRCNKNCWMCGRKSLDSSQIGDLDFTLLQNIASQLPSGIVVQLHRDGEPLLYPRLSDALSLFSNNITNIVTNGKLLLQKKDEIIGCLDTLSISIFENDPETEEQYELITEFLAIKKTQKPFVTLRLIGNINAEPYSKFGQVLIYRKLRNPVGYFGYKTTPNIPEVGICWDFLHKPCIGSSGNFSVCCSFDPDQLGVLGNLKKYSLQSLWNGETRTKWRRAHIEGRRDEVPLCANCEYWGVPG